MFLFNDRSFSEIERILLHAYCEDCENNVIKESDELSLCEKIFVGSLKHLVIKGNNDKNVLVLIDKLTQESTDLSLAYRPNFCETNNPYLFDLCDTNTHINGYDVFRKHLILALSDHKVISLLASTRYRRHLATILQILQMNSDELTQLQISMGHTPEKYGEFYWPLDTDQIAKLSKMLLHSQNICTNEYKERQLDDLGLIGIDGDSEKEQTENDDDNSTNESKSVAKRKRRIAKRRAWTYEEKSITDVYFNRHITEKLTPRKEEVLRFMEIHRQLFKDRTWEMIKAYVCNRCRANEVLPLLGRQ
ncbi:hypothetical protein Trydic_g19923 [Trypoxylus dichotomus]